MSSFLVFTSSLEGCKLAELLSESGESVCISTTSEYANRIFPPQIKVLSKPLDEQELSTLLKALQFDCVIDATHPDKTAGLQNLKAICAYHETRCLRLSPWESSTEGCVYAENAAQAAEVLSAITGKALLTIGSKDLDVFTRIPDYQSRIYVRVLPAAESVEYALECGYGVQNIIAMQGPFTREMNGAMMRQLGISILVTKQSGESGGFIQKLGAAQDTGATVIVIGRVQDERGLTWEHLLSVLESDYRVQIKSERQSVLQFPLFMNLTNKRIGLFGGGAQAIKRAQALLLFCNHLMIIDPQPDPQLVELDVPIMQRSYMQGDCARFDLIIAATGNREINHVICEEAKGLGIPFYANDAPQESAFQFPEVIRQDGLVIGLHTSEPDEKRMKKTIQLIEGQIASQPICGKEDGKNKENKTTGETT